MTNGLSMWPYFSDRFVRVNFSQAIEDSEIMESFGGVFWKNYFDKI